MNNYDLIKGDFLISKNNSSVYAIWDGKEDVTKKGEKAYSIMAYSSPFNSVWDAKKKKEKKRPILAVGFNGQGSGYIISESNLTAWRKCSNSEVNDFLLFLAENGVKWNCEKRVLEPMAKGEKIRFDDPDKIDGNGYSLVTIPKKTRSRQKKDIAPMSFNKNSLVRNLCEKYNDIYHPKKNLLNYKPKSSKRHNIFGYDFDYETDWDEFGYYD